MFAVAFDLSVERIAFHYDRSVSQAYADIGATLRRFGFRWIQGSVYLTDNEDLANLTSAMVALKALSWFPAPARGIRAFRVGQWSDFAPFIKEAA